jgi:hypothetical protein
LIDKVILCHRAPLIPGRVLHKDFGLAIVIADITRWQLSAVLIVATTEPGIALPILVLRVVLVMILLRERSRRTHNQYKNNNNSDNRTSPPDDRISSPFFFCHSAGLHIWHA